MRANLTFCKLHQLQLRFTLPTLYFVSDSLLDRNRPNSLVTDARGGIGLFLGIQLTFATAALLKERPGRPGTPGTGLVQLVQLLLPKQWIMVRDG